MKIIFTAVLIMLINSLCLSQATVKHEFKGFIIISGNQKTTYKLIINELADGKFKGFSITDYEGPNYTESLIEGELNMNSLKMSFREVSNIETKYIEDNSTFCYVTATDLPVKVLKKGNVIAGKFDGLFPSGKSCATGNILLVNKAPILENKKVIEPEPKKIKPQTPVVIKKEDNDLIMTSDEELLIQKWGNNLMLEVWDGDMQDDDIISIYLDDKLLKENIVLSHYKNVIKLPTCKHNCNLKIVAVSQGTSGDNTVNFKLKNSENNKDYVSELKKGESFIINFNNSNINTINK